MKATSFEQFAGLCAILVGIAGFLYSVAFIIIARRAEQTGELLSGLFLMLGGLLTVPALIGLYHRLRETDAGFALLALLLGFAGAAGSTIHGGYNLANAINRPDALGANLATLPNPIDPRGLLTFGVAGLGLFFVAWLITRGGALPRGLGSLGYLLAVLLVIIYVGRLTILRATHPVILIPALLAGFLVNPAWYIWLGVALRRAR